MEKFKVGDKVLVEVEIVGEDALTKEYQLKPMTNTWTFWAKKDRIHQLIVNEANTLTKTYDDGLKEAWELAKKIILDADDGGFDLKDITGIFEKDSRYYPFEKLFAQEAAAKVNAWKDAKEIHVGDVVKDITMAGDEIAVVTYIDAGQTCHVLWNDGSGGEFNKNDFVKTGRTIDIAGLLAEIGRAK